MGYFALAETLINYNVDTVSPRSYQIEAIGHRDDGPSAAGG